MSHPKFIIETDIEEGDFLLIGKCEFHEELATDREKVKSGGWWCLDKDKTTFILSGASVDFGRATKEDILNCIQNKRVFIGPYHHNITLLYSFNFLDHAGNTHILSKI